MNEDQLQGPLFEQVGKFQFIDGHAHLAVHLDLNAVVSDHLDLRDFIENYGDSLLRTNTTDTQTIFFLRTVYHQGKGVTEVLRSIFEDLGLDWGRTVDHHRQKRQLGGIFADILGGFGFVLSTMNSARIEKIARAVHSQELLTNEIVHVLHDDQLAFGNLQKETKEVKRELILALESIQNTFGEHEFQIIISRFAHLMSLNERRVNVLQTMVHQSLAGRFPVVTVRPHKLLEKKLSIIRQAKKEYGLYPVYTDSELLLRSEVSVVCSNSSLTIVAHLPFTKSHGQLIYKFRSFPIFQMSKWLLLRPEYDYIVASPDSQWALFLKAADLLPCSQREGRVICDRANHIEIPQDATCLGLLFQGKTHEISGNCPVRILSESTVFDHLEVKGDQLLAYRKDPGFLVLNCPGENIRRFKVTGIQIIPIKSFCVATLDKQRLVIGMISPWSEDIQLSFRSAWLNGTLVRSTNSKANLEKIHDHLNNLNIPEDGIDLRRLDDLAAQATQAGANAQNFEWEWIVCASLIVSVLIIVGLLVYIWKFRKKSADPKQNESVHRTEGD